jgi:predicted phosphohydrolase
MKFQLISDIHLEFHKNLPEIIPKAPYLLLAGDVGYPEQPLFEYFLKDVSKKFNTVFYTPGNHEYYQKFKEKDEPKLTILEIDNLIKNICSKFNNIIYLNKSTYDFDNYKIIGATLWSNIKKTDYLINDYNQIYKNKTDNITINDIINLHNEHLNFIKSEIKNSQKINIVMTHHLPSKKLILAEYIKKYPNYNSHFASDLDYLLDPEYIHTWVCGHSHSHIEENINDVPCYLNALGYPSEEYRGSNSEFTFTL